MKPAILATALAAVTTLTADAALITWGAAQTITGDSDVSTNGTLVNAFNLGGPGAPSPTVNGVTFAAFGVNTATTVTVGNYTLTSGDFLIGGGGFGFPQAPFTSLSASYRTLLDDVVYAVGLTGLTLTIAGLNVGDTYEFQWWANDSLAAGAPSVTATAGTSVSLDPNVGNGQGLLGQFAMGTFVADSTSQAISFSSTGSPILNGFQLRNVTPAPEPETPAAVPEPGTALAGVMLAGLLGVRRRRGSQV